jgi:hypothetical protein
MFKNVISLFRSLAHAIALSSLHMPTVTLSHPQLLRIAHSCPHMPTVDPSHPQLLTIAHNCSKMPTVAHLSPNFHIHVALIEMWLFFIIIIVIIILHRILKILIFLLF